ncbi:MAG: permease, partial [Candidatus Baltobacteraceae bacterium]
WQFTAGEWIGGVVLVTIMSSLVKITYPKRLVDAARTRLDETSGHEHGDNAVEGRTLWDKLRNPQTPVIVAQNVAMDWSMLWKDLLAGFLIAGALAAFVPGGVWSTLFLQHAPPALQIVGGAVVGPLVAVITFVCSIGNVPMAAVLWASGVGFGGVLAFLYGDLIVLPLLDVYRKYYGWKMAAYIGVIFYVTMVAAAVIVDLAFNALHLVPQHPSRQFAPQAIFQLNYTFWLNVIFGAIALWLWTVNRRNPMEHGAHEMQPQEHAATRA